MTDLEKLRTTFDDLGIDFDLGDQYCQDIGIESFDSIYLGAYIGNCQGYSRLYTVFNFDKETGKLVNYGVWE